MRFTEISGKSVELPFIHLWTYEIHLGSHLFFLETFKGTRKSFKPPNPNKKDWFVVL